MKAAVQDAFRRWPVSSPRRWAGGDSRAHDRAVAVSVVCMGRSRCQTSRRVVGMSPAGTRRVARGDFSGDGAFWWQPTALEGTLAFRVWGDEKRARSNRGPGRCRCSLAPPPHRLTVGRHHPSAPHAPSRAGPPRSRQQQGLYDQRSPRAPAAAPEGLSAGHPAHYPRSVRRAFEGGTRLSHRAARDGQGSARPNQVRDGLTHPPHPLHHTLEPPW